MAAFGKTHGAGGHNFADGPLRNRLCPHNAYLLAVSVYVHGSEAIVLHIQVFHNAASAY